VISAEEAAETHVMMKQERSLSESTKSACLATPPV
jgi:hypothetical protein